LLLAMSSRRWRGPDSRRLATIGLGLAALAALDGVGLAVIHLAAGVGGARTLIGAAAGIVVLALALSARRAGS
jgi:Na+/H+ antiporter NhaD/arsenite permease-like protein